MDFFAKERAAPVMPKGYSTQPLPGEGSQEVLRNALKVKERARQQSFDWWRDTFVVVLLSYVSGVHIIAGKTIDFIATTAENARDTWEKMQEERKKIQKEEKERRRLEKLDKQYAKKGLQRPLTK